MIFFEWFSMVIFDKSSEVFFTSPIHISKQIQKSTIGKIDRKAGKQIVRPISVVPTALVVGCCIFSPGINPQATRLPAAMLLLVYRD